MNIPRPDDPRLPRITNIGNEMQSSIAKFYPFSSSSRKLHHLGKDVRDYEMMKKLRDMSKEGRDTSKVAIQDINLLGQRLLHFETVELTSINDHIRMLNVKDNINSRKIGEMQTKIDEIESRLNRLDGDFHYMQHYEEPWPSSGDGRRATI